MTKRIVSMTAGLAALALCGAPAGSEPVPARAAGVWSVAECGSGALTVQVNSSMALMVETWKGKAEVAIAAAEWAAGSLVVTVEGESAEWVLPPLESLQRCDSLPGLLPILFAETIAVFRRLDEIDAACRGEDGITARCVAVAFDLIDVSGDGTFSRAEISRAVRAAGFFIGHRLIAEEQRVAFVPVEELYVAYLAASALGPFVAGNLIDSYDFDGDGFLALGELMQDRSPEEGLEGVLASMASEMAPEALSAVMKSMTGLLGLLQ